MELPMHAAFMTAGVAAMLLGERFGVRSVVVGGKISCSLIFVHAGLSAIDAHAPVAVPFFAALALSFLGDVLLLPKKHKAAFLFGLSSFLLAHVGFAVAFLRLGVDVRALAIASAVLVAVGAPIARWLLHHVPAKMRIPVVAYMLAITAMVACAAGTAQHSVFIVVGAALFYASDICVARERFIAPGFANKLAGWPLYFGAQLVLVAGVAGVSR